MIERGEDLKISNIFEDTNTPFERFQNFTDSEYAKSILTNQQELTRLAEKIQCKEDIKLQGYFPEQNEVDQILYCAFLQYDALMFLDRLFPEYSNLFQTVLNKTIFLFTSDEPRYDTDDWRVNACAERYTNGEEIIYAIAGDRNHFLRFRNEGLRSSWHKNIEFTDWYMGDLLASIEETFHVICMEVLNDTPVQTGQLVAIYNKYKSGGEIIKKDRNFDLMIAMEEGLAAFVRYKFIFELTNTNFAQSHPQLLKDAIGEFDRNHRNYNHYRNTLEDTDGNPLKPKSQLYRIRNGGLYAYIFGIEIIGELIEKGWSLDRNFELLEKIKNSISPTELESAKFSLFPNSKYQKLKRKILELINL